MEISKGTVEFSAFPTHKRVKKKGSFPKRPTLRSDSRNHDLLRVIPGLIAACYNYLLRYNYLRKNQLKTDYGGEDRADPGTTVTTACLLICIV